MSSESFAAFRRHSSKELADLAEEHFKHDLTDTDRTKLHSAATTVSTYAAIGSAVGLSLGAFLAFRLRRARKQMFAAMRGAERPTHIQFADGRTQTLPDLTPYMHTTTLGDLATYTFFGAGGLFIFGEAGALAGTIRAKGIITEDTESKQRIEAAFRNFRKDVLKKQIQLLDEQDSQASGMISGLFE